MCILLSCMIGRKNAFVIHDIKEFKRNIIENFQIVLNISRNINTITQSRLKTSQ